MEFGNFNVVPTLLFNYTGDQYGDLNEPVWALMESYSTMDLAVAISDKADRYRLSLYARNLTDESYAVLTTSSAPRRRLVLVPLPRPLSRACRSRVRPSGTSARSSA